MDQWHEPETGARCGGHGRCRRDRPRLSMICGIAVAAVLVACSGKAKSVPPATAPASPPAAAAQSTGGPGVAASGPASAAASAPAAPAAPLTASRVETVKLAADLLLDRYYKPLKSSQVLASAWKGAAQVAAGHGTGQVSAPQLSGDRASDWQTFAAQYGQLYGNTGGAVQGTDLAFGAVQAMVSALNDDHTYFLSPADNKRRQADDNGGARFVGVGISISQRAPFIVQAVIGGGPAETAGVKAGDEIAAIDGTPTTGVREQDVADKLRGGAAGSTVAVSLRGADGATRIVQITRAEIIQPAIETKVLPDGVGYIALHNFADAYARFADGKNIEETLDAALAGFEQAGVKGWIFDVRGNPGGSEQTLAEIAGRFVAQGIVLVSADRAGQTTEAPVGGHLFSVQRPLALLIDGQSGSASELLAATLKEYGRARLFGQRTAGAVNGALESELPDGAAIQYTVVEGRTGKQHTLLDGVGVTPDEAVSGNGSPAAVLAGRADPQFDRARAWLLDQAKRVTPPVAATPASGGTSTLAALRAKLQPLGATMNDVPPGPGRGKFGDLVVSEPAELAVGLATDVPNAAQFVQQVQSRHWLGGYEQFFGSGDPSPYAVSIDLYADESGARDAVHTDDYPTGLKTVDPGMRLGDDTVGYAGYDAADGSSQIVWRRGKAVFTVQFSAAPGQSGLAAAAALAKTIDARAATLPAP